MQNGTTARSGGTWDRRERQFASVLSNPIVLPKATGVPMLRSDSRRLVLRKLDRLAKRPRVTLTVSLVLLIPVPIDQSQPGPGEGVRAFFVTPAGPTSAAHTSASRRGPRRTARPGGASPGHRSSSHGPTSPRRSRRRRDWT
jgi:hypothetical protein